MKTPFHVRYAWRSFLRSGQRSTLGVLCIAFGVMSLVALQLLSAAVRAGVVIDPRAALAGDFQLSSPRGPLDERALELARERGLLTDHTLMARLNGVLLRRVEGGRVHIAGRVLGVSGTYPLVGSVELETGSDADALARVLAGSGNALLTADVARALSLDAGDEVIASDISGSRLMRLKVAGVVRSLPDRRGSTVILGLATARAFAGDSAVRTAAVLAAPGVQPAHFAKAGWHMRTQAHEAAESEQVASLFDLMLEGAGLLGLLVGAVGVVNTLYVALARRTAELATLKTLGYSARDLVALLGIETLLLGVIGSVLGGLAAIGVGAGLGRLLTNVQGAMTVLFRPDARIIAGGMAVGVVMSVVFGLFATVRAAGVRPAVLLRQESVRLDRTARLRTAALALLLLATFVLVCTIVLGSVVRALGTVLVSLAVVTVFTGLVALVLAVVLRLPVLPARTGLMVRRALGRNRLRAVAALGALSIGIFAIGFAGAIMLRGFERLQREERPEFMDRVLVVAPLEESARVADVLAQRGITATVDTVGTGAHTSLRWQLTAPAAAERADEIAAQLPGAMVIAGPDIAAFMAGVVRALFMFVAALSGLALLAGVVLIANAVGLGLLERRRELALLKALGYTRVRVLGMLLAENALLGVLGSGFGIALVAIAVRVINQLRPQAAIELHAGLNVALLAVGTTLCLGTALLVAWRPTSLRPLVALREE